MKKLSIIFMICLIMASCKKENLLSYTEKSRIYLSLRRDSLYSKFPLSTARNIQIDYAPQKSSKKKDTIRLHIKNSGSAAQVDRSFVFERNPDLGSGIEGTDFDLLDKQFVIPAGKFNTVIRVVINRNPNMAKKVVSFGYKLKANENFDLGPNSDTTNFSSASGSVEIVELKFTAKDIIIKPGNWDTFLQNYFGLYSEVKFRFIIDVLGLTNIPSTTAVSRMNTYRNNLRTALNNYNATNPEMLKDENGNLISF